MSERKRIYLCLAHMSEEGWEQKYIQEAFDTNWVVPLGPNVNGFEADLEKFVGENKRVVALSSGTAAVHLGLLASGVKPGDEVLVQSFTFCASTHPITYLGATPVMIDSEPDTWNMDPELLAGVPGIIVHSQPAGGDYDSNYWLCTITIDPDVRIKGQENAYKTIVKGAVGGAAGVIHMADSATTDCQPNDNVEALRVLMDQAQIEARPVWKPMHKQPCYASAPAYVNGVSEALFKVGMCLPAGPYVGDDDVRYIVETIKGAIVK